MQITQPEVGKTYISNIPDAPEIKVRIKVESLEMVATNTEYGIEGCFVATCSFPDEPGTSGIELVSDEWAASGFSLEAH